VVSWAIAVECAVPKVQPQAIAIIAARLRVRRVRLVADLESDIDWNTDGII